MKELIEQLEQKGPHHHLELHLMTTHLLALLGEADPVEVAFQVEEGLMEVSCMAE